MKCRFIYGYDPVLNRGRVRLFFFFRFCSSFPFISVILLFQFSFSFLFSLALFMFFEVLFFYCFCCHLVASSYLSHYGRKFHAMFFLARMIAVIKQDPSDGTLNWWGQYEGKFHVLFRKTSAAIRNAILYGLFFFRNMDKINISSDTRAG